MTPKFPSRFFCLIASVVAAGSAWAGTASPVTPLGGNTYSLTVKATNKFTRNTDKLKDEAIVAATDFCTKEGKQFKQVALAEDRSLFLVGPYAQVTLTFKALGADDPELSAAAPAAAVSPAAPPPLSTDELYASLMKLDDLRKKGILTDEEFAAEKKKLLARSK